MWTCGRCGQETDDARTRCALKGCKGNRPRADGGQGRGTTPAWHWLERRPGRVTHWRCRRCGGEAPVDRTRCPAAGCAGRRPLPPVLPLDVARTFCAAFVLVEDLQKATGIPEAARLLRPTWAAHHLGWHVLRPVSVDLRLLPVLRSVRGWPRIQDVVGEWRGKYLLLDGDEWAAWRRQLDAAIGFVCGPDAPYLTEDEAAATVRTFLASPAFAEVDAAYEAAHDMEASLTYSERSHFGELPDLRWLPPHLRVLPEAELLARENEILDLWDSGQLRDPEERQRRREQEHLRDLAEDLAAERATLARDLPAE